MSLLCCQAKQPPKDPGPRTRADRSSAWMKGISIFPTPLRRTGPTGREVQARGAQRPDVLLLAARAIGLNGASVQSLVKWTERTPWPSLLRAGTRRGLSTGEGV